MNRTLSDLQPGDEGRIVSLEGGHRMQSRLRNLGFIEGNTIRKLAALALGGPIVVEVNRTQVAIGRGMARRVWIRAEP